MSDFQPTPNNQTKQELKTVYFKIIKSSLDGISGLESNFTSIDEVLREVFYHKGWESLDQLHAAIRKWSENAHPGSVFYTQVTAIVAVAADRSSRDDVCHHCGHKRLHYEEIDPVTERTYDAHQKVICPNCRRRWYDCFIFSERAELSKPKP